MTTVDGKRVEGGRSLSLRGVLGGVEGVDGETGVGRR